MDFVKQTCNPRPRCIESIPRIEKFLAAARSKAVMLIYTTVPNVPMADTLPAVAPKGDEPVIAAAVNKFNFAGKDTGLEKMLKDKGITSVIAIGTAANGAVLYTASEAALRGFNVIVPVDGMSGSNAYRPIRGLQFHECAGDRPQDNANQHRHDQVLNAPSRA